VGDVAPTHTTGLIVPSTYIIPCVSDSQAKLSQEEQEETSSTTLSHPVM